MVSRWVLGTLVLVLLNGGKAFNPLPLIEDEIASFVAITRDPSYRLPTTTSPRLYDVTITPYFENVNAELAFTFDGEVTIYLSANQANVNEIVMHCDDLTIQTISLTTVVNGIEQNVQTTNGIPTCEMPQAFFRVITEQPLSTTQEYTLRITYRGNIQSGMRGFYRSWYYDSSGVKRWMGTTQFQPGHARNAFPCYDEPGFKAIFTITINREPDFSPSISNMPIANSVTLPNGRIAETFYPTPQMSTYLIAFIVSHYVVTDSTPEGSDRPFAILARDNVGTTGRWAFEVGVQLLEAMEEFTGIPYYSMAPFMDMKQAAIPDFSAGAMENWGLLTYREALILYDDFASNAFYRQRVANIVSHEITHMWFGNLVTCAWWDNLWLNEGFARHYQYYLTGMVRPELGYETRFMVEQFHVALLSDSIDSAHALTSDVYTPTEVSAHFSTITYAKGACVIRMTQHLLGDDTYLQAIRAYLDNRKFDVATPEDLFSALEQAAAQNQAMLPEYNGITVTNYFRSWSEQAGYPLLTVNINHQAGTITVIQSRWERTTGVSSIPTLWHVPITWTRQNAINFDNTKPVQILTEQVTVINRTTTGFEWVIFNLQQTGYYRVNYDRLNWGLLTLALRGNERNLIHEYSRAQIVDDVFAFARAGTMTYSEALNILSFLEFEDGYAPWLAAITGFNWMIRRVAHEAENLQKLYELIHQLSSTVVARLGYAELDTDTYMDGSLRMYLMDFLCDIEHPGCIAQASNYFQQLRNGQELPGNSRSWVYCSGLRQGTADDYNFLWNRYIEQDLAGEKIVLLGALGCTKDPASLNAYLTQIVTENDNIRVQDYTSAFSSAVYKNDENVMVVFEWLKDNIEPTTAAFGSLATPFSYITSRLIYETDIAEFETWLTQNQAILGAAYATGVSGVASARTSLQWSSEKIPSMAAYLENGYQEFVLEDEQQLNPEADIEGEFIEQEFDIQSSSIKISIGFLWTLCLALVYAF